MGNGEIGEGRMYTNFWMLFNILATGLTPSIASRKGPFPFLKLETKNLGFLHGVFSGLGWENRHISIGFVWVPVSLPYMENLDLGTIWNSISCRVASRLGKHLSH